MDSQKPSRGAPDSRKSSDGAPATRPRAARTPAATKATGAAKAGAAKAAATTPATTVKGATLTTGATRGPSTRGDGSGRAGPDAGTEPWPDRPPGWRGRARNRDLYNRRAQRAHERWPMVARLMSGLLRRPEVVLTLLGATEPVEREGRVLNPSVQALVGLVNRFDRTSGGTADGFDRTSGGTADGFDGADGSPGTEVLDPLVVRRQLRRSARAVMPVRTDVYVSARVIPGTEGAPPIGIRIYRQFGSGLGAGPAGRGRPAIVFFHGGGWVSGDLDSHDALCRILTAASGCLVVAVGYRLAPEDPFPAAVDDALAAYTWVHQHSDDLGIAPGHIGVMGDSAGGNLAAVVAQVTRAGAGPARALAPPPVAQGLVYPVLDTRLRSESLRSLADGFLLTRTAMEFYRNHYLPDPSDWEDPKASPLLAGDFGGLAPALVVTAGFDPMRDDGVDYAEALRQADVSVEHRRYDDQIHGFMVLGIVADSLALATEVCESMGRLMRRSAPTDPAIGAG
ncbi:MAG: alpha/beta hydrolase [Acidimicrobiales bacterium]